MNITIEKATNENVDAIATIEEICFTSPFKRADIEGYIDSPFWRFFVAKADNLVIGHISILIIGDLAQIGNIAVLPEFRGLGVGSKILDFAIKDCKKIGASVFTLEVRKSNAGAIHLYEKFGFLAVGVSKNHYSSPQEDAILMNLNL